MAAAGRVEATTLMPASTDLRMSLQFLRDAALSIRALIDEGVLVRDITHDGDNDWLFKQAQLITKLQRFVLAIEDATLNLNVTAEGRC